jgi:hypothetical protein
MMSLPSTRRDTDSDEAGHAFQSEAGRDFKLLQIKRSADIY